VGGKNCCVKGLDAPDGREGKLQARIRALEDENEKLATYAVRVKAEIDELKRVINRCH
jgi:molecular chaperone GrpE (heat shock protein)